MSYPFPKIERKVYSKTFLKDVQIKINYTPVSYDNNVFRRILEFTETEFNLLVPPNERKRDFAIKSEDEMIAFQFKENSAYLKMRHPLYKSFENTKLFRDKLLKYIGTIGVEKIKRVEISKYNELLYRYEDSNSTLKVVMETIFSESLLHFGKGKKELDENFFNETSRWEATGNICGEDELQSKFTYQYGFCKDAESEYSGRLTLKTIIASEKDNSSKDLPNILEKLNLIIDEAFHWCIRKEIIDQMN